MQGKRLERVEELIKQALSESILTKMRDSRLGFVTITAVKVSPDLSSARVYYSVFGDEKVQKSTAAALGQARGFLQRELASEIKLRVTPALSFQKDPSLQYGMKIEGILRKIHEEDTSPGS